MIDSNMSYINSENDVFADHKTSKIIQTHVLLHRIDVKIEKLPFLKNGIIKTTLEKENAYNNSNNNSLSDNQSINMIRSQSISSHSLLRNNSIMFSNHSHHSNSHNTSKVDLKQRKKSQLNNSNNNNRNKSVLTLNSNNNQTIKNGLLNNNNKVDYEHLNLLFLWKWRNILADKDRDVLDTEIKLEYWSRK